MDNATKQKYLSQLKKMAMPTVIRNLFVQIFKDLFEQSGSSGISDGSVTTSKIADGAVTSEKIHSSVVEQIQQKVNRLGDGMFGPLALRFEDVPNSDGRNSVTLQPTTQVARIKTHTLIANPGEVEAFIVYRSNIDRNMAVCAMLENYSGTNGVPILYSANIVEVESGQFAVVITIANIPIGETPQALNGPVTFYLILSK